MVEMAFILITAIGQTDQATILCLHFIEQEARRCLVNAINAHYIRDDGFCLVLGVIGQLARKDL